MFFAIVSATLAAAAICVLLSQDNIAKVPSPVPTSPAIHGNFLFIWEISNGRCDVRARVNFFNQSRDDPPANRARKSDHYKVMRPSVNSR